MPGRVGPWGQHLLGVHGGGPTGAEDEQAGAGIGVQQAGAIALAQSVQHAGLIEVHQRGQIFQPVAGRSICLCDRTSRWVMETQGQGCPARRTSGGLLRTFSTSSSSTSSTVPSWSSFTRTFPSGRLSSSDLS